MILKWIFDRVVALIGLLFLWPVLLVTAVIIKIKMPGGPAFFVQKRVGRNGKLFKCHKFRSMLVQPKPVNPSNSSNSSNPNSWSSVSVAGDSRITPFGAKLRHYKIDELPELWDVLFGNMSFVGPRPDVPGYADKLEGEDRDVLKLRPGITGPATLKYRLEDEQIAAFVAKVRNLNDNDNDDDNLFLPENVGEMSDQEIAVWYNDNVIYPDKVRLNCYYYRNYFGNGLSGLIGLKGLRKDLEMIFATVLGRKISFAGEEI